MNCDSGFRSRFGLHSSISLAPATYATTIQWHWNLAVSIAASEPNNKVDAPTENQLVERAKHP
jgi:hypothetical protein